MSWDEPVSHTIQDSVGDNRIDITLDDGARSSLWWATKNEWLGLLDVAGLKVEALYGGFAGWLRRRAIRRRQPGIRLRGESLSEQSVQTRNHVMPKARPQVESTSHRGPIPRIPAQL